MENGNGPSDLIRRTLEPLVDERETLADELRQIDEQRAAKKGELTTVEKLLRQAGMIDPPEPKQKASAGKGYGVSDTLVNEAAAVIADFNGDQFTIGDVEEAMGVAQGTARKAIDRLTEKGEVRFLGKRAQSADRPQKVMKWTAV